MSEYAPFAHIAEVLAGTLRQARDLPLRMRHAGKLDSSVGSLFHE
jgi:hypothetical protein